MSFRILPNNQGMIFVPDCKPGQTKHLCPDCFTCQWCANERCRVCKGKTKGVSAGYRKKE